MINMYNTNPAVFNSIQSLNNSEMNIIRLMKTSFNSKNKHQLIMFMSLYHFYYTKTLTIDFTKMDFDFSTCKRVALVRELDVSIDQDQYDDLIIWIQNFPILESFTISINGSGMIDTSKFPESLRTFNLRWNINTPIVKIEHDNLRKITVSSAEIHNLNLDKLPKLVYLSCNEIQGEIKSSVERFFDFFRVQMHIPNQGDISKIFLRNKEHAINENGYSVHRSDDQCVSLYNERSIISEKFYERHPYADTLEGIVTDTCLAMCNGNEKIKTVVTEKIMLIDFKKYFVNLERVVFLINNLTYPNLQKILEYALMSDFVIIFKIVCVKMISPLDDILIPSNLKLNIDTFKTDDTDFLLKFVQKLGIINFGVYTESEFSPTWFNEYNYIRGKYKYYFTKKPHPGVIINDIYPVALDRDIMDSNCDHVEIYCMNLIRTSNLKLRNLFISGKYIHYESDGNVIENFVEI